MAYARHLALRFPAQVSEALKMIAATVRRHGGRLPASAFERLARKMIAATVRRHGGRV
ncbi:MAG: hypothetical protein KatS3mg058_3794 [Roseiflexus sp.]|jgi:hypothetical protein|nr:MAG: hypothetical protein KatS3mg058_3794 [Roseiflexus sp.]